MAELVPQIIYALMRPAARTALHAGVALKDMKRFVELAYYQEARRRGLKMREITETMDISMSKVGALSKQLKEHFREAELEHGLKRQILALLWAMPLSAIKIAQALPEFDDAEIIEALDQLVTEGSLSLNQGRTETYELVQRAYRLSTDLWMARVDGLNTLLDHVLRVVEARFFEQDPRAAVRNLRFRVSPDQLQRLQDFYEQQLFPLIIELDEHANASEDSIPIQLSYLWSAEQREPSQTPGDVP